MNIQWTEQDEKEADELLKRIHEKAHETKADDDYISADAEESVADTSFGEPAADTERCPEPVGDGLTASERARRQTAWALHNEPNVVVTLVGIKS